MSKPKKVWPVGSVREVHAQRARKLRKRGVAVKLLKVSLHGRSVYVWFPSEHYGPARPPRPRKFKAKRQVQRLEGEQLLAKLGKTPIEEFKKGDQVVYVSGYARAHGALPQDLEYGVVSGRNAVAVFVRFKPTALHGQSCDPDDLVRL